jgi:hypothetical protein
MMTKVGTLKSHETAYVNETCLDIWEFFDNLVDLTRKFDRSKGRDSSVGIATTYGLDDRGVGIRVPVR